MTIFIRITNYKKKLRYIDYFVPHPDVYEKKKLQNT
jgi:hypothetical protein